MILNTLNFQEITLEKLYITLSLIVIIVLQKFSTLLKIIRKYKVKNGVCNKNTMIPQCIFDGGDCLGWQLIGPYMMKSIEGLHKFDQGRVLCHEIEGRIFEPRNHRDIDKIYLITCK